jgi:hypothetical protein
VKDPKIVYTPLNLVERWPRNPKKHDIKTLRASLSRFGFIQPLLLDESSMKLVAGHGRLEALIALKAEGAEPPARILVKGNDWLVPVLRGVEFANEAEAEAYLVADNRMVELGGWDDTILTDLLKDMPVLDGVGFDAKFLERAISALGSMVEPNLETHNAESPAERTAGYLVAAFRQIVLVYPHEEYEEVGKLIEAVKAKRGTDVSNSELFKELLHAAAAATPD